MCWSCWGLRPRARINLVTVSSQRMLFARARRRATPGVAIVVVAASLLSVYGNAKRFALQGRAQMPEQVGRRFDGACEADLCRCRPDAFATRSLTVVPGSLDCLDVAIADRKGKVATQAARLLSTLADTKKGKCVFDQSGTDRIQPVSRPM